METEKMNLRYQGRDTRREGEHKYSNSLTQYYTTETVTPIS